MRPGAAQSADVPATSPKKLLFATAWLLVGTVIIPGCKKTTESESRQPPIGQERNERMCSDCQGMEGEGYAADKAPALGHPEFQASVSDELLRHAISEGRTDTTMSAWSIKRGGPLPPAEVDAIIAYLRKWKPSEARRLNNNKSTGSIDRGQALYTNNCVDCHGKRGVGGANVGIGNPELLKRVDNGFLRHAIAQGRSGAGMPGFWNTLGPAGIEDLVALLRDWENPRPKEKKHKHAKVPPLPLGEVPMNPDGPDPKGFLVHPGRTSIDVIKPEIERGAKMVLLDARAPSAFTREHIPGAVSVPFYDPEPYFDELPRDAWLIAYCSCPTAESTKLAAALKKNGFEKVTILKEGLKEWRKRKYPTEGGKAEK